MGDAMDHETGMQDSDDRAWGTVGDVAAAYGVSADTIRRRMRKGELEARREQIPSGYRWLLPMPAPGETLPGSVPTPAPVVDHAAMVDVLRGELQARNEEIARLTGLLESQGRALESALQLQALPAPAETDAPGSAVSDEAGTGDTDTPAAPDTPPLSGWARVKRWLLGG